MIQTNTYVAYDAFFVVLVGIFNITVGSASPRLVVTESDGTVIYDTSHAATPGSSAPGNNTNNYANWQSKLINENHNTRMAIMTAQMFPCGVGYETKYSSSVGTNQAYVAIRAGVYTNNAGTFRLSINA